MVSELGMPALSEFIYAADSVSCQVFTNYEFGDSGLVCSTKGYFNNFTTFEAAVVLWGLVWGAPFCDFCLKCRICQFVPIATCPFDDGERFTNIARIHGPPMLTK